MKIRPTLVDMWNFSCIGHFTAVIKHLFSTHSMLYIYIWGSQCTLWRLMDDTSQEVYQVRITATIIFHVLKVTADLSLLIDVIYGFFSWAQKWNVCLCCQLMQFKEEQKKHFHFSFLYLNKKHWWHAPLPCIWEYQRNTRNCFLMCFFYT